MAAGPPSTSFNTLNTPPNLQGALYAPVGVEGAVWQLDRAARTITIHLEKDSPASWPVPPYLDLRSTTWHKCAAVPRWARI